MNPNHNRPMAKTIARAQAEEAHSLRRAFIGFFACTALTYAVAFMLSAL